MYDLPEVQEGISLFEIVGIDFDLLVKQGIAFGLKIGLVVILLALGINFALRLFKQ